VTIDSDIEFVDASARTKNIKIAGNAPDNTILGGNDSLWGGADKFPFMTAAKNILMKYNPK